MEGPLAGRAIAVTRAATQAPELSDALTRLGAFVIEAPAIAFSDPPDFAPLDRALARLAAYDWIVFTSRNTLPRVVARMQKLGLDPALLASAPARIVAIGPATARELAAFGLEPEAVPGEFRAEGVVELMADSVLEGTRVLLPRALAARDVLPEALKAQGARVDVVPVYRTEPSREGLANARDALVHGTLDAMTFTSASTVTNAVAALGADARRLAGIARASIGPVTSHALRDVGSTPTVEARQATIAGLVAALVEHYAGPIVAPFDPEEGASA